MNFLLERPSLCMSSDTHSKSVCSGEQEAAAEFSLWCSQTAAAPVCMLIGLNPARLRVQKILLTDSTSLFRAT